MKNEYLRHTIATINYRFQKSVKDTEDRFGDFDLGKGSRSTNEIINHMYQVLISTRAFIEEERFEDEVPEKLNLTMEIERFNSELKKLMKFLPTQTWKSTILKDYYKVLFQIF